MPEPATATLKPMRSRRQFLAHCSALAVAASLSPSALAGRSSARGVSLDQISLADFAQQLNSTFVVRPARDAPVPLLLVEVRPLGAPGRVAPNAADAGNEKFALLFRGAPASPLAQGTHAFEHPRVGSFAMFVVPIGCVDQSHRYYEAIFNRPARAARTRSAGNDAQ